MIESSLYALVPLFALFVLFMIGFHYAWTDFRPRKIKEHENEKFSISHHSSLEHSINKKEYSLSELGIKELGNIANLPDHEQRLHKMNETVRNYAIDSPELAANVVQRWLKEK